MDESHRRKIENICKESTENNILITHGTDTIDITAKYLNKSDISNKKIVLTGSSKPLAFSGSDAPLNIGTSLGALNCIEDGVYVCMHGKVHKGEYVKKLKDGTFVSE